jgi:hypothetical protein
MSRNSGANRRQRVGNTGVSLQSSEVQHDMLPTMLSLRNSLGGSKQRVTYNRML